MGYLLALCCWLCFHSGAVLQSQPLSPRAAWAEPHCDSDFPNSVCVTVPGSPVPLMEQTRFSFSIASNGSMFSSHRGTGSDLYKFLFGEFISLFFPVFFLQQERRDAPNFASRPVPGLWWMSCFLWRFLFMTVTIHSGAYRHCTVCCYVMGLLSYAELIYTPFCNGISCAPV